MRGVAFSPRRAVLSTWRAAFLSVAPLHGSQKRAVHSEFPCSSCREASAWCSHIGTAVTQARASCPVKWKGVLAATVQAGLSSYPPLDGRPPLWSFPIFDLCVFSLWLCLATCCADLPVVCLFPLTLLPICE